MSIDCTEFWKIKGNLTRKLQMAEYHEELNSKPKEKIRRSIIRRLSKHSHRESTAVQGNDEMRLQIQKAIALVQAERYVLI